MPRNMIINLGCTLVDNNIPREDIFDYHPLRECYIYIIFYWPNFALDYSVVKTDEMCLAGIKVS